MARQDVVGGLIGGLVTPLLFSHVGLVSLTTTHHLTQHQGLLYMNSSRHVVRENNPFRDILAPADCFVPFPPQAQPTSSISSLLTTTTGSFLLHLQSPFTHLSSVNLFLRNGQKEPLTEPPTCYDAGRR